MSNELMHYGVPGMKWGVRHEREHYGRHDMMNTNNKMDTAVTRKVKGDYNRMSNKEFKTKYRTSKNTYRKRVNKTGDPYGHRLAKTNVKAIRAIAKANSINASIERKLGMNRNANMHEMIAKSGYAQADKAEAYQNKLKQQRIKDLNDRQINKGRKYVSNLK